MKHTNLNQEIQGTYHKQPRRWITYIIAAIIFATLGLMLADEVLGAEEMTYLIAELKN